MRFGATMVMISSLFTGHDETPGDVELDGAKYKTYFGSASNIKRVNIRTSKVKTGAISWQD